VEDDDDDDDAKEKCPFCNAINYPMKSDVCEHFLGVWWDNEFIYEGLGSILEELISEWSKFGEVYSEIKSSNGHLLDEFDKIFKKIFKNNNIAQNLLDHSDIYKVGALDMLHGVLGALPGNGWSTGGMLGGSGSGVYRPDDNSTELVVNILDILTKLIIFIKSHDELRRSMLKQIGKSIDLIKI
jgi:hypothetical protein